MSLNSLNTHRLHRLLMTLEDAARLMHSARPGVNLLNDALRVVAPRSPLARGVRAARRNLAQTSAAIRLVRALLLDLQLPPEARALLNSRNAPLLIESVADLVSGYPLSRPAQALLNAHKVPRASAGLPRGAGSWQQALVTHVIDGDTLVLQQGVKVRLIGIDAPELHGADGSPEPWAREAQQALRELSLGKTLRLARETSQTDRFGRLLRHLYAGELWLNAELVRRGMAYAYPLEPDTRHAKELEAAQAFARHQKLGIWQNG
ncbi:MAG: hypothetical protein OHK0052_26830 [Anaerolineales bacterium]